MIANPGPFNASDLPIVDGRIYHLQLKPEELSPNVIIVGDPERVPAIAKEYFDRVNIHLNHRGLVTITSWNFWRFAEKDRIGNARNNRFNENSFAGFIST